MDETEFLKERNGDISIGLKEIIYHNLIQEIIQIYLHLSLRSYNN